MRRNKYNSIDLTELDWLTVFFYLALIIMGWLAIYSSIYNPKSPQSMFDFSNEAGRQFFWMGISLGVGCLVLILDYNFWTKSSILIYGGVILLLLLVFPLGSSEKGAHAWFEIGPIKIQPAEFSKVGISLALAYIFELQNEKVGNNKTTFLAVMTVIIPCILILLENETGTVLILFSLIIMFYREGLHFSIPLIGITSALLFVGTFLIGEHYLAGAIGTIALIIIVLVRKNIRMIFLVGGALIFCLSVIYGSKFFVEDILQKHQRERIYALFDPESYSNTYGYQPMCSFKTIGHGGFSGRGRLEGELTHMDQVSYQHTDFVFSAIGEEVGWLGSSLVIIIYIALIIRLILLAERQKVRFSRVFGYSAASILFFHLLINVGMTIGMMPVIGIPLPFFSYGGSSLITFTALVFIMLRLDVQRSKIFGRN